MVVTEVGGPLERPQVVKMQLWTLDNHTNNGCLCMRRPLPKMHPELEIRPNWPLYVEYRVNNWRLAKDGTGRVRRGFGWSFWDIIIAAALVYLISHPSVGGLLLQHRSFFLLLSVCY